jgi:hypothetical protein
VLGGLQERHGGRPALRTRVLATLVIVGLFVLTAPVVLVPLIRWALSFL